MTPHKTNTDMKRLFHLALALLCIAALFSSCEKAPFVTMTGPRSYTFTRGGGTQTFAFSCNRDWSVSSSESWIRITPSSGKASDGDITVTITCSPNTTYDPRTATVTLKVEELTETISVTQNTGLGLIVSPTTLELTNAAQNIEVEVQKNVQYTVAIDEAGADWIKQGGTKALTTDKVTFRIEANTSYDNREGHITFKQTDGDLTETVTVRQSQTNGLFITTPEYNLSNKEHNLSVEVKANVAFEVASQSDWIEITETKALVPSTVMLSVKANESYDNRTGTVLVKQTNGDLTGIITINQKQTDYLTVTPNSKEVTSAEQTIDVDVTDNVSYSVVIPDDAKSWISVVSNTQTKALIDDKVILAIAQNLSYDSRTASVTIKQKDGPLAETVEIKQAQGDGLFVTTPEYTLSNEAHTVSVELKANVEFEVSSEVDWIACVDTKALSTSTVTLSVAANERYDDRTGKVKIKQKNGALEETVTINQKQTDYLSVSPTSFDLSNAEETVTIEVKDNVSYNVVIPDDAKEWITVQSNTQTKALVDDKVVLAIAKNTTYDNREASVTIKQVDGSLAGTVAIKQAYGEGLIPEKTSYEIDRVGGSLQIDVQANVEYVVSTEAKWIHYAPTKALSNSVVSLTIDENPGYTAREATVALKQKNGSIISSVIIKQSQFGSIVFEGDTYKTIKYGDREWFAENLRAKFGFDSGEHIDDGGDVIWPSYVGSPWAEKNGEYVYSMEQLGYSPKMKEKTVCPEGWHISTIEDWEALFSMNSSSSYDSFVKKELGGNDSFSFGGVFGKWHVSSFWFEMWLCDLFEDCAIISKNNGAYVESRSANQRHFPAEDYRFIRCVRGKIAPIIQTLPVIKMTTTTAELRVDVLNDPNASFMSLPAFDEHSTITKVLFKYGTQKENLSSSITSTGAKWTVNLSGLAPGTTYYYQPIVEYDGGSDPICGEIMSFKTYYGTLEYQGEVYFTTLLGNVEIMSQNLRSSSLNDGTPIPLMSTTTEWLSAEGPGQCIAFNKEKDLDQLGRLYNGYAIQTNKVCPEGWRLPKYSEVINEAYGRNYSPASIETGSLFLSDRNYWANPVLCSNDLGLSLLPSGCRYGSPYYSAYYDDLFYGERWQTYFWALNDNDSNSLNAICGMLQLGVEGSVYTYGLDDDSRTRIGFSVRCVREK